MNTGRSTTLSGFPGLNRRMKWTAPFLVLIALAPYGTTGAESAGQEKTKAQPGKMSKAPAPAWRKKLEAALQKKYSFAFEGTPFSDVIEFFRQASRANIVLDEAIVDVDRLVTMRLKDVSLRSALNLAIGDKLGLKLTDEVILLTTRHKLKVLDKLALIGVEGEKPRYDWEKPLRAALQKGIECSFEGTPMRDMVAFLRHFAQQPIVIDPDTILEDERLLTVRVWDVKLNSLLNLVCKLDLNTDLDWGLTHKMILIADRSKLKRVLKREREAKPRPRPDPGTWQAKLEEALRTKIKADFKRTPLVDVIEYLRQVSKANMLLDQRVVAEDERRLTMALADTLEDALNIICRVYEEDLSWTLRDEVIHITASKSPETSEAGP